MSAWFNSFMNRANPAPCVRLVATPRFVRPFVLVTLGLSACASLVDRGAGTLDFETIDASYVVDAELDLEFRKLLLERRALPPLEAEEGAQMRQQIRQSLTQLAERSKGWVPPQRVLDDLALEELRGPEAWEARRASYQETGSAKDAYLFGRLEVGERAKRLFGEARQLGPELSWARHGFAWLRTRSGDATRGGELEEEAIDRAASLYESLYFERAGALAEVIAGDREAAEARLQLLSTHPRLLPEESAALRAWVVGSSFSHIAGSVEDLLKGINKETGEAYLLALALLRPDSGLADADLEQLVSDIKAASFVGRSRAERMRAMIVQLEGRDGREAVRVKERLQLELVSEGLDGLLGEVQSQESLRAGIALLAGDLEPWLAKWRKGLPRFLSEAFAKQESGEERGGLHLNEGLVQLLMSPPTRSNRSQNYEEGASIPGLEFLPGLVMAGWFKVAEVIQAGVDSGSSPALRARALAASSLLTEIEYIAAAATEKEAVTSLNEVLQKIERVARDTGWMEEGAPGLLDSPRLHYGQIAEVVHPGPVYLGGGERPEGTSNGDEVGGLAKLLSSLGRVGIAGQQMGMPDLVVRPLLAWEWISGEHLGAPYEGTVFWCQGVDVPSRFERGGAGIAGAALHEGYWIDIEAVRVTWDDWRFQRAMSLASSGEPRWGQAPKCETGRRTQPVPLLGEAQRLALRMFVDRANNPVDFDELLRAVAIHEEGHLCDRARFLPFGDHLLDLLQFLVEVNFSPLGVMRRLEYRAQLVALCEVADSRLVLFDILSQVEGLEARASGEGITPHAAAYQELLSDLVAVFDSQWGDDSGEPEGGPFGLEPDRYLRWQLHTIAPAALRSAALVLAKQEGLVE